MPLARRSRLGYGLVSGRVGPGLFRRNGSTIDVGCRAFVYDGVEVPEQTLHVEIPGGRVRALEDGAGTAVPVAQNRMDAHPSTGEPPMRAPRRGVCSPTTTPRNASM